jgi:pyridoxine 5-phosphate synthase
VPLLSVNLDHIATLRQARYRQSSSYGEPDIARAVHEAELGGADGITIHLREDRRHVTDRDARLIRTLARVRFNFEMAATDEMVAFASTLRPHSAMLVPEGRHEVTTEGGLDVAASAPALREVVRRLRDAGCLVSAFLDAEPHQIDAAHALGFDVCEVHTGPYAEAFLSCGGDFRRPHLAAALDRVARAGAQILALGMRFNAGHALNYENVSAIAQLPGLAELHIGHSIISRSVFSGLRHAVAEMQAAIRRPPTPA